MKEIKTKCVITGHHNHELTYKCEGNTPEALELQRKLRKKIIELIENDTNVFLCGMELGVELLAGEILLDLKQDYPHIKICSVIASEERANDWSEVDRERYFDEVLPNCDEEDYASVRNDEEAMPYRNKLLARSGDIFLAVWNGGEICDTADLIRKAKKLKKEVIIIDI